MIALVAALGVLGGAGVGLGMGAAFAWRGSSIGALPAGGAIGGLVVGAIGSIIGADGIAALTGANVPRITGMFEGLLLGLAAGVGAIVAVKRPGRAGSASALAAGAGALSGTFIALAGGTLLGGSLYTLDGQFPASELAMDRVGAFFAEPDFGSLSQGITAALEGATFAACIAAALSLARIGPVDSPR